MREHKIPQLLSSLPISGPLNSRRQIWKSRPLSFQQSQSPGVSISIQTRPTTSSSLATSHGTFRSTAAGTLALQEHSLRATMAPARDLVGPSAIDEDEWA